MANDNKLNQIDTLEHAKETVPGYNYDRKGEMVHEYDDEDDPNVHQSMHFRLFLALVAMSFLWVGSQIPLYLFGSVLPLIYSDIGGADRYVWAVIGYLIPVAALCPL